MGPARPAISATVRLVAGPASAVRAIPLPRTGKPRRLTGTGLAHPEDVLTAYGKHSGEQDGSGIDQRASGGSG